MDKILATADKEVLVDIVKLVQKHGMRGAQGGWKEFLDCHDKKFGAGLSDPRKRSMDVLIKFLLTFTKQEDLKFFNKIITCQSNHKLMEQLLKSMPDMESPEQRLVRLTVEHPLYKVDYSFPSHNEEWVVTKLGKISKAMKSTAMIAIDCEMVLCEDGKEAVVRVCAVDRNLEVKLNKIVKPNKGVADYRTDITGVSEEDLKGVTCSLVDVQKSLKRFLRHGTILVGHSLNNDLQALKVEHARVIDSAFIFKIRDESTRKRPSLNNLCKSVLGYEVRKEGDPHNCLEDARAAMNLILAKLEHGFEDAIDVAKKEVTEIDLSKLLLHGVPNTVDTKELAKVFPKYPSVEVQPVFRLRGQKYSTFVIFKDYTEAHEAFEKLEGKEEKDSYGRPQKVVSYQLGTGDTVAIYVRKMTSKEPPEGHGISKKRSVQDVSVESKKQMLENSHECDHIQEAKKLRKELRQREEEILNLQKILSALTRKHGL